MRSPAAVRGPCCAGRVVHSSRPPRSAVSTGWREHPRVYGGDGLRGAGPHVAAVQYGCAVRGGAACTACAAWGASSLRSGATLKGEEGRGQRVVQLPAARWQRTCLAACLSLGPLLCSLTNAHAVLVRPSLPPSHADDGRDCTYYTVLPGGSSRPGSVLLDAFEPPLDFVISERRRSKELQRLLPFEHLHPSACAAFL